MYFKLREGSLAALIFSLSAVQDNIVGVHAMNKWQQKWAMDEFVAGRLGPGEMGNGVLLEEVSWEEKMRMNAQYYDHAFQQYVSDIISVNRSLPDRSVQMVLF